MDILDAIILGIIQGLTEWLPISSSGHLAIAQHYMDTPPLVFDIMLHFGTILVLIFYFRKEISNVRKAIGTGIRELMKGKSLKEVAYKDEHSRMAWFILIGIVPTAAVGLLFNFTVIEHMYSSMLFVGASLILTGCILILTIKLRGRRKITKMTGKDAWLIGFAQGIAIAPGISRSGATIGIGLFRGIDAETAGRYSFLLSIPSVVGAMLLHIPDLFAGGYDIDIVAFIVGMVVAIIVGYASLALLMRILKGKGFHNFAYYCWVAGALVIIAQFF